MPTVEFPRPYSHDHPPIRNVYDLLDEKLTPAERAANRVTHLMGSWRFIIIQSLLLSAWVTLNVVAWVRHWDPYPFILMNLTLSLQAAYTAPVILMSQNRQAMRDRAVGQYDFVINQKAEEEIRAVLTHLEAQNQALALLLEEVSAVRVEFTRPTPTTDDVIERTPAAE